MNTKYQEMIKFVILLIMIMILIFVGDHQHGFQYEF